MLWSSIKLHHYKNCRGMLHVGVMLYWRNLFFQTLPRVNERFCPSVHIVYLFDCNIKFFSKQQRGFCGLDAGIFSKPLTTHKCKKKTSKNKKNPKHNNNTVKSSSSIVHAKDDWARVTFSQRLVEAISGEWFSSDCGEIRVENHSRGTSNSNVFISM